MTLTLTILGCGSSAGVPRPALGWGACDPKNPKNRRRRCSLLAERGGDRGITRVLIDTSPDLREQLIDARVDHIDGQFAAFDIEPGDRLHATFLGKLDGVPHQVQQQLAEPSRVADDRFGDRAVPVVVQRQTFAMSTGSHDRHDLGDQPVARLHRAAD